MGRNSQGGARRGLLPRLGALALGAGIGAAVLIAPSPAWAIPPGGYCYSQYYNLQNDLGQTHKPYGTTKHFDNQSGVAASWTESLQVSTTFTSTTTTTTTVRGGVDFGIVKAEVERVTQTTTFYSLTVNKTSSFTVSVPAYTLMYAQYGAYGRSTSGRYYSTEYACDDPSWVTSYTDTGLQAFNLTSEGWRLWEA